MSAAASTLAGPAATALGDASRPPTTREMLTSALQVARGVTSEAEWTAHELALAELLDAVGWRGSAERLVDALPHVDPIDSFERLASVLERLGVAATLTKRPRAALAEADFPAAYATRSGPKVARDLAAYEARDRKDDVGWRAAQLCSVTIAYAETKKFATRTPSFFDHVREVARDDMIGVLSLTAVINLFVLAVPFYAISVYNLALPANAGASLLFFTLLAIAALVTEDYFRGVRGNLLAGVAARLHARIMGEGVRKRLGTPLSTLERVSTAALLAQFKRMENLIGFFQSGNARALIDAPFVLIFLLALGFLGGWIVLVPLIAIVLLIVFAMLFPTLTRPDTPWSEASRWQTKELVRETVLHAEAIREAGVEGPWLERLAQRLDQDASNAAATEEANETSAHVGQAILGAASAATLGVGAYLVMHEQLSIGGLMAATILVLRILGPIHALAQSLGQLRELREDIAMIEQMLAQEDETATSSHAAQRRFQGTLRLNRVGHRFQDASDFALRNVSFELKPGERLAVVGPGGSGRSLLLRVAIGLTTPTLGTASLDGLPLSQIASDERRGIFGYAPLRPEFLYGTIAQNMRFARMDVGDFEIEELLEAIGLPLMPEQFPEGLRTRLTEIRRQQLGVTALQKLNIARAILSRRPVLAFDNVFSDLDPQSRAAVLARLDQARDRQSVILVGAHRDVIEACDTTLAMKNGAIVAYGPTQEVLPTITHC